MTASIGMAKMLKDHVNYYASLTAHTLQQCGMIPCKFMTSLTWLSTRARPAGAAPLSHTALLQLR